MSRRKTAHVGGSLKIGFWDQFNLGESYVSFLLGLLVVIVVLVLLVTFVKSRRETPVNADSAAKVSDESSVQKAKPETSYTVAVGDSLWSIAEEKYKSGYKWVEIAKANNLSNPDYIFADTKLQLPKIEVAIQNENPNILSSKSSISEDTYTIQTNDYLWDIAVRAYGDGFKWVEIAKANNLTNPDLIFSGNTLKIPRET